MPRDYLRIIKSKSKVRNSSNKPVVVKVSSSSSTPGISPDVAELKDMVKALLLDKKNQIQAPSPVKAVEESCVTCGGAHSYRNCPATDGNVYRDNIQEPSISRPKPIGIAEDVYLKVGKFKFRPQDFVVVDFDVDTSSNPYSGCAFFKNGRALIDVYEGELTLRVRKEAVTFNLDQSSCLLNFDDYDWQSHSLIMTRCFTSSPTLTPFEDSDFLLEEVDAFLALEDDPTSSEVDDSYYDPEGDILLLESFLNNDPSLPPPTQGNYLPEIRKELKVCEAKTNKSSIDEPPKVKLKDLPPHLEYAFLE
ncbi:hypothetical protein Tco_0087955 [Tanacetum coccineum]